MKSLLALALIGAGLCGGAVWGADEKPAAPAGTSAADPAPVKVDATKKDQIDAAVGKNVVVSGTIASATWTASGKTLQVMFKDGPDDFRMIAYGKNREALDKAFGGDIAAALTGKRVEISGKLKKYAGSVEKWKKYTDLYVGKADQIKVIEANGDEKKPDDKK